MITFAEFILKYSDLLIASSNGQNVWQLTAEPWKAHELLAALRAAGFDYPEDLTCVDEDNALRVQYRLYSIAAHQLVHVTVRTTRTGGLLPTACDLWRGFEWQEREAFDLFGVVFEGHPDLRRILTWEGFSGHPLLKDYVIDNDDSSWQIPEQNNQEIIDLLQQ